MKSGQLVKGVMQNMTQNRLTVNRRVLWTRGEIGGDEIDRVVLKSEIRVCEKRKTKKHDAEHDNQQLFHGKIRQNSSAQFQFAKNMIFKGTQF